LGSAEPLPFYTDDAIDEFCRRTDLAYFAETVLDLEIVDHHRAWSELLARYRRLGINAPRDHGKSYFFSFAYVIWRLYYGWVPPVTGRSVPKRPVGYVFSSTEENAIAFLDMVKSEIETNDKLRFLLPHTRSSWSKTEIVCANRATVRARGWQSRVRGGHPVWIIADDVLNDETIYSEVQRQKQIDYFYSAVTPMLVPGGQMCVVGTPFHETDLYASLKANAEYHFYACPAINPDGTALWPTRYSREMLEQKKREVGATRFTREYLCTPISDTNSLFPDKIIKDNLRADISLLTEANEAIHNEYQIFTGVDLALSSTVGADYTVITTLGIDKFKNRRILDIKRFKGRSMTEQLREIERVHAAFRPLKIFIEDNAFQRVFADELVRNTDLPVEGYTTTASAKNSLERGIPSLQVLFENAKFQIPRATERDRRITDELIHELRCFSFIDGKLQGLGAHDDMVMSLWIAGECACSSQFSFSFI
jgi:hypothetical protein